MEFGPMRPSLTVKILFPSLTIAVLVAVVIFGFLESELDDQARREFTARTDHFASAQAAALTDAVWSFDQNSIDRLFGVCSGYPDLVSARLITADGEVLQHYERPPVPGAKSTSPNQYTVSKELVRQEGGEKLKLGSLEVMVDETQLLQSATTRRRSDAAILVALAILLAISMATTVHWQVGRPLTQLRESLTRNTQEREKKPLQWRSRDEIGEVVAAYNVLLARQAEAEESLRSYQQSLEQMVENATAELKLREALQGFRRILVRLDVGNRPGQPLHPLHRRQRGVRQAARRSDRLGPDRPVEGCFQQDRKHGLSRRPRTPRSDPRIHLYRPLPGQQLGGNLRQRPADL